MDKETRNLIQRATQDARGLLEQEYREQLEGAFDVLLDGTIAPEPGSHLDGHQRLVRQKLVVAIEHKKATGQDPDEAVAAYLREAAFTTLNRFVALKMLEARGLVQECVSKGDQSSGFKEFTGLAPGAVALPDHGYRMYIESLFDEIGREVRVLFDRRDPASLLWPRRQALHDLLAILNRAELAEVWAEDETIGWVYQYFNSQEERRAMRDASQAPRNSHELAVRNQFFTPRYVVQFLTDNTLGRIWYEMRKGDTQLVEQCQYLVRRPKEIFLPEGGDAPEQESTDDLSQEELLKHPVYIPHRPKKDPRDLKILDPACGSGHFLLYCFDLLTTIYEEAWADQDSPPLAATGGTLRQDYDSVDRLRRGMPGLILRHNLHGIDIDPRCVQIAAFALWMRAQRAYNEFALVREQRPTIRRTNVVVAEPMPGERDILDDFLRGLREDRLEELIRHALDLPEDKRVRATRAMADSLCDLVCAIWERMNLAGEAGSLLRVEQELADAIADGRAEWEDKLPLFRVTEFAIGSEARDRYYREVPGQEEDFWHKAEALTIAAVREFAEQAASGSAFQRRLFADDAERGFAFIDLCRHEYDCVLMNPPFGLVPDDVFSYLREAYPDTYVDVYGSFVVRGAQLACNGYVGAITSRSFIMSKKLERWRQNHLLACVELIADLGRGVMDAALIDSAAYILRSPKAIDQHVIAIDARSSDRRDVLLWEVAEDPLGATGVHAADRRALMQLPGKNLLYFLSDQVAGLLTRMAPFEPEVGTVRAGLRTFDDFRFLRLRWEVEPGEIGVEETWEFFAKGGEYANYYTDVHLLVNRRDDGAELAEKNRQVNGQVAQSRQGHSYYYRPGCQYTGRSAKGFSARAIPAGCVMSSNAPLILTESDVSLTYILGWVNSRLIRSLIQVRAMSDDYVPGLVKRLPWLPPTKAVSREIEKLAGFLLQTHRELSMSDETDPLFSGLCIKGGPPMGIRQLTDMHSRLFQDRCVEIASSQLQVTALVDELYGIDSTELGAEVLGRDITRDITVACPSYEEMAKRVLSVALGCCFGRWDARVIAGVELPEEIPGPFEPLRSCAPAEATRGLGQRIAPLAPYVALDGVLHDDPGHKHDVLLRIRQALDAMFKDRGDDIVREAIGELDSLHAGSGDFRSWFRRSYFEDHVKRYSKSRRKAPIYWELATPSGSYAIWLYYHRLTKDTFYKVLNDYVKPKLSHEQQKLAHLRVEAGPNPTSSQRRETDTQEAFAAELRALQEEVERIAPLWNPDINDGVIINFAPLWRLVRLRSWQSECKEVWSKLVKGDYDWSHLAMHLWPERVVPKCTEDRSLAIAHGLEEALWEEDEDGKWQPKEVSDEEIEALVDERTSPQVKAALNDLLSAPAPTMAGSSRRRTRRSGRTGRRRS